jgi:hypothetical protein
LFSLAVKRYLESRAQYATKALEEPTVEKVIRALFDNTVAFLTAPGHPRTCMTLAEAVGCSVDATPARDIMTEIRKQNEVALRERFLQARRSGELSKDVNVDDYTRYLSSILGRSIHPGIEWFNEDKTQADLADGPSASGLLRRAVADSRSETELSASHLT